jgi:putative tricarboxylic transport membrane protein
LLEFFGLASWSSALVSLLFGSALGFLFGFVPGLGGRIGLILSLPIAVFFPPHEAAIFLFAMHSVVNTSGAIPNIAFGIPSSSADMATIIDGYPLAKMGRAGEALGASLSASAIGGVLGAVAFLISIPIARPLVTSFGPPEFLLLSVFGVTMVASLSREGLIPGLAVGALGVLVSTVGVDFRGGEARYAFGWLELWDGVGLPAIVCGLFVVPEMLALTSLDRDSHERAISTTIGDVFRGMFVTFRHMRVVLRSTLYGIVIGFAPAVGSSISVWMAYDYAARTTKSDIPFGQGAIAGVIAPEAANNSKEGGAMIPTLFFGIPGSSSMAIMMAALAAAGVAIGPSLLTTEIGLSFSLAAAVCLANLIAVPLFFLVIPTLVRLSSIRRDAIVPFAIAVSVTAALIETPRILTIVLIVIGSIVGIVLRYANWPRAPFILGYVIGDLAEKSYFHTVQLYGWSALSRPFTLGLAAFLIGWLVYVVRTRPVTYIPGPRMANFAAGGGLILFFAAAAIIAGVTIRPPAEVIPIAVSVFGGSLCAVMLFLGLRTGEAPAADPMRHVVALALYLAATPFVGLIVASFAFCLYVLRSMGIKWVAAFVSSLIFCALQSLLLFALFDLVVEKEIIGRIAWSYMGL